MCAQRYQPLFVAVNWFWNAKRRGHTANKRVVWVSADGEWSKVADTNLKWTTLKAVLCCKLYQFFVSNYDRYREFQLVTIQHNTTLTHKRNKLQNSRSSIRWGGPFFICRPKISIYQVIQFLIASPSMDSRYEIAIHIWRTNDER